MIEKEKAGCIVFNKNDPKKILLIKTIYSSHLFSFPKGHLEDNETFEECAIRETREETGLNVSLIKELGICINPDYYCNELGKILFYLATPISDEIDYNAKSDNATTIFWFDYKEILDLNVAEDHKRFYIEHFKKIEDYILTQI